MEAEIKKSQVPLIRAWQVMLIVNVAIVIATFFIWGPQVWPIAAVSAAGWVLAVMTQRKPQQQEPEPEPARKPKPIAGAAKFVEPDKKWDGASLWRFLGHLPTENIVELRKSLGL